MQVSDFLKLLESQDLRRVDGGSVVLDDSSASFLYVVVDNKQSISFDVTSTCCSSQIILVGGGGACGRVDVRVSAGARLNLLEVLFDGSASSVCVEQCEGSIVRSTVIELGGCSSDFSVALNGEGAESEVSVLQMCGGDDRAYCSLRLSHNVAGCVSRSVAKCVAGGDSVVEFRGLVYVAEGAQRTEAYQNSRNIALSGGAKIISEPQLEIYADDVKCSHGATVGQMNQDAIFYMQQRGLSESAARRLQLEGFVSDITSRCAVDALSAALSVVANAKLELC